jgi:hypothetical protein
MNRNDFIRLINIPYPVDRHIMGELNELIEIFPYFQSAHLLLLKGLHDTGDVKFGNQLKRSAIYIADREVLYYLLKSEPETVAEPPTVNQASVPVTKDQSDNQQTVIESAKSSEDFINELEKNSLSFSHEAGDDNEQKESGHSILVSTETDNYESGGIMFVIDEESGPIEERVNYMDPGFTVPERTDLLELETEEVANKKTETQELTKINIAFEEKDSNKLRQADLIDKFIISNPRIVPVRDKSDLPVEDLSKPHIEEQGGFVTETLARIYISQGYYSKAINIYEKLSLKFPEKISYFASQIEKVQELIKK